MNPCKGDAIAYRKGNTLSQINTECYVKTSYVRFEHTKTLLENSYCKFMQGLENGNMILSLNNLLKSEKLDEKDITRLFKRIERWNRMETPIPMQYLEILKISKEQILIAIESDEESFRKAIKTKQFPDCFFANISSGVIRIGLPEGTDEDEAIVIAASYTTDEPIKARYICIKDLKTIVIEPDKSHYTLTYPPLVSFRNNLLIPCNGAHKPA